MPGPGGDDDERSSRPFLQRAHEATQIRHRATRPVCGGTPFSEPQLATLLQNGPAGRFVSMSMAIHALERASSPAATLKQRIRAEYDEMPCLRLTLAQAARFWNVDRETCRAALDQLVSDGVLAQGRFGYVRV